ncbi:cysteine desulfurase-like protein [Nesterenkonia sp.]|uniref:cysteine desulfurase-like protein n=1 Tax=Nesterenkonia sp. TaxID=704201 RepID=UPI00262C1CB3|nr:cysteine desulfurase-like protein [Nesterenkonia sp.]
MTGFDVNQLRSHFPALDSQIAFFDSPGGTQTPRHVAEAIARTLTAPLSNRGTRSLSERNAEQAVAAFRAAYADFLGADPAGIVYGRSATQLTYDFSRHLGRSWGPGDEVVVTRLDHDSNIRPWVQAAERTGTHVRWVDFDPETGELDAEQLESVLGPRTRLVALTAASNLIGTVPDVRAAAEAAHRAGALVYVDGVHFAAHRLVDLAALGADFFVCSPYKFLGPHCAVLAADPQLLESIVPDKLLPSTNEVPERFEYGTLPYEVMAGAAAAVDFLAGLGGDAEADLTRRERLHRAHKLVGGHEHQLAEEILASCRSRFGDDVVVHSRAADRTPTLLLSFPGRRAAEVSALLYEDGVHAPAGSFYAYEAFQRLGIDDDGALRLGVAPYTSAEDVQRLLSGLERALVTLS